MANQAAPAALRHTDPHVTWAGDGFDSTREVQDNRQITTAAFVDSARALGIQLKHLLPKAERAMAKVGVGDADPSPRGFQKLLSCCVPPKAVIAISDEALMVRSLAMREISRAIKQFAQACQRGDSLVPVSIALRHELHAIAERIAGHELIVESEKASVGKVVSDCYEYLSPVLREVDHTPNQAFLIDQFTEGGAYVKRLPGHDSPTKVITNRGGRFALLTHIDEASQQKLAQQKSYHAKLGKHLITRGREGAVGIALDEKRDNMLVAKKVATPIVAQREIKAYRQVRSRVASVDATDKMSQLIDYAHVQRPVVGDVAAVENKSYLFYELANQGDALRIQDELFHVARTSYTQYQTDSLDVARQMTSAVAALHRAGTTHRDIKLENFLYDRKPTDSASEEQPSAKRTIRVGDFSGFFPAAKDKTFAGDYTERYLPPELFDGEYNAKAHDAFSLGLTLLLATQPGTAFSHMPKRLQIPGHSSPAKLKPPKNQGTATNGVNAPGLLKVVRRNPSLKGVIASLLQESPKERLSVIEAERLLQQATW